MPVGEVRLRAEVSNADGRRGRAVAIDALVDTGAVETLLPRDLVRVLGLRSLGKMPVLADERRAVLPVAGPVLLGAFGRRMVRDCLVGPAGCEPLVGQIVLERLDLVLDPRRRSVRPRSAGGPVLKMK